MDDSSQTLYIVIPESNAATIKKLRGLGIAFGCSVITVTQFSDLPNNPGNNSILVVPDQLAKPELSSSNWDRIIVVERDAPISPPKHPCIITIPSDVHGATDWARLTEHLLRLFWGHSSGLSWHAIKHQTQVNPANISTEFIQWSKKLKINGFSSINKTAKILDKLKPIILALEPSCTTMVVGLDEQQMQIDLKISAPRALDVAAALDKIDGPNIKSVSIMKSNEGWRLELRLAHSSVRQHRISFVQLELSRETLPLDGKREAS